MFHSTTQPEVAEMEHHMEPTMTPRSALDRLLIEGTFTEGAFTYELDGYELGEEGRYPVAEDEEGNIWLPTGEHGEKITADDTWELA
jgi:hypothetical protein